MKIELDDIRGLLPGIDEVAYFQTSGFSPKPRPVVDEVVRWLRFQASGPAHPDIAAPLAQVWEVTRAQVARAVGATPEEIALTENATIGINIVAHGIDWRPGDGIVLTSHEHPGNRVVWYAIAQRSGAVLRFLDADGDDDGRLLDDLERALPGARIVSVSHVSRRSGRRLPVATIVAAAHRRGVPVLLDGAQAFGAVPVDVRSIGCDFYTLSGHKYILGPQATGALFVRRDRIGWLRPSWLGSRSQRALDMVGGMELHESAQRFEWGTRNVPDQAGLGVALHMWEEIGWERVFARIAGYAVRAWRALAESPGVVVETPGAPDQASGIVSFRIPGVSGTTVAGRLLERHRILVSPFEAGTETVRVSTHVFNTDEELERLVTALRKEQF